LRLRPTLLSGFPKPGGSFGVILRDPVACLQQ
jgi:hypothetical protein